MNGPHAPKPAVTGKYAFPVQMCGDGFDAHRAGCAVTMKRKAEHQAHGVGVKRVYLQLLLDLGPALLGGNDAVADRRERTIPKALASIFTSSRAKRALPSSLD